MRLACALLTCLLTAPASAQTDRRYFYEDILEPFFAPDPARPGLYRAQRPGAAASAFALEKPKDAYRVFVIGGSIARMFIERQEDNALFHALTAVLPGRRVETINCGMAGYDSDRELLVLREVLRYRPDLIVLMTGHNEKIGRRPASRAALLARRWVEVLGLARLWPARSRPGGGPQEQAERARGFERNLRTMLRLAKTEGVPALTMIPPLNYHAPPAGPDEGRAVFLRGWLLWLAGKPRPALDAFKQDAQGSPGALGWYYRGLCEERLGLATDARRSLEGAVAADRTGGRCGPSCAGVIRRVSGEEGERVVDVDAAFRAAAFPGLPGLEEFADAVHWRQDRDETVAAALASALGRSLAPKAQRPCAAPGAAAQEIGRTLETALAGSRDPGLSHRALAYLAWVYGRYPRLSEEPAMLAAAFARAVPGFSAAWGMSAPAPAQGWLYWHVGLVRLQRGELAQAERLLRRAAESGEPRAALHLALASALRGRARAAAGALREIRDPALALERDAALEILGLSKPNAAVLAERPPKEEPLAAMLRPALRLEAAKDYSRAATLLERLAQEHPGQALIYKDLGVCRYEAGQSALAMASLETAIRLDPRRWDAYQSLAAIHAGAGRAAAAVAVYDRALSRGPGPRERVMLEQGRKEAADRLKPPARRGR